MERLTHEADFGLEDWEETLFFVKSDPNGAYNIIDIAKYQGEPEFDEILKNIALRLAAYENTDLEPEDILRILEAYGRGMTLRTESAQRLEIVKGIQTDRLRELAQADREGRCVVLPCKRDDVLWTFHTYPSKRVYSFHVTDLSTLNGRTMLNTDIMGVVDARDVGKTAFLTRAEAEAALRREQDG